MFHKFIIGIDLGGTNLKVGLLDLRYKIRFKNILSTRGLPGKSELIKKIIDCIQDIKVRHKLNRRQILGIGLGVPGPVDFKSGTVHFFPNIPGWKKVRLRAILEKKLKLPVFIDNDANLMALAEHRLGAARASKNAVCLTLGTGVGSGIIINGQLYRGSSFAAGELGHVPINEKGPLCNCGGHACLEAYVGNKAILRKAKTVFNRDVTLEELSRLAKNRNKKAIDIWQETADKLGIALTGAVNFLNPDSIVIGGGVANAGNILFAAVRRAIRNHAMAIQAKTAKVSKAKLGNDAGIIGAAILLKESQNSCNYL